MTEQKKQPVKTIKACQISATVWKNDRKDGQDYDTFSVNVVKQYIVKEEGKDDVWKTTSYFNQNELPKVVAVTQKAYEYLILKEEEGGNSPSPLPLELNKAPNKQDSYFVKETLVKTPLIHSTPTKYDSVVPKTDKQRAYNHFAHKKASLEEKKVLGIITEEQYHDQLSSELEAYMSINY